VWRKNLDPGCKIRGNLDVNRKGGRVSHSTFVTGQVLGTLSRKKDGEKEHVFRSSSRMKGGSVGKRICPGPKKRGGQSGCNQRSLLNKGSKGGGEG